MGGGARGQDPGCFARALRYAPAQSSATSWSNQELRGTSGVRGVLHWYPSPPEYTPHPTHPYYFLVSDTPLRQVRAPVCTISLTVPAGPGPGARNRTRNRFRGPRTQQMRGEAILAIANTRDTDTYSAPKFIKHSRTPPLPKLSTLP